MNAYLFSWVNGAIVSEPVLTSTQWKDWAAVSLPPSPSLRSLMLKLNHALRDPEIVGLGRDLNYFLEGEQTHIFISLLHLSSRNLFYNGYIHLLYPFSILSAEGGTHIVSKALRPHCFDLVQLLRTPSEFHTGPCWGLDSNKEVP